MTSSMKNELLFWNIWSIKWSSALSIIKRFMISKRARNAYWHGIFHLKRRSISITERRFRKICGSRKRSKTKTWRTSIKISHPSKRTLKPKYSTSLLNVNKRKHMMTNARNSKKVKYLRTIRDFRKYLNWKAKSKQN